MRPDEPKSHYSIGEVEGLISTISDVEYKQIILLIEQLNPHRAGCTGEELYERALSKILTGVRKWRRDVKRATFVRNVVRSLISSEIKKNQDALSIASGIGDIDDMSDLDLTADLRNDDAKISNAVHELMAAFQKDEKILCIILNKLKNYKTSKIKTICKLTEQSYQAAYKKLRRNALKLFPQGIDYWREEQ